MLLDEVETSSTLVKVVLATICKDRIKILVKQFCFSLSGTALIESLTRSEGRGPDLVIPLI